jgi:hypothetical protein
MNEERMIDPRHDDTRRVLRVVGPAIALIGLGFTAVGFISFFSAFGTMQFPRYFWCVFVGLPMLGIGLAIAKAGYMGAMFRYFMGEAAPVGKDTFNYMARGTGPAARDFARDVSRGVAEGLGMADSHRTDSFCPQCGAETTADAHYCSRCGAQLAPPAEGRG